MKPVLYTQLLNWVGQIGVVSEFPRASTFFLLGHLSLVMLLNQPFAHQLGCICHGMHALAAWLIC